MMNNGINIKEYDTFALACDYTDDMGKAISLDDLDITADMQSSSLSEQLTVTKMPETGRFTLSRVADHLPFGQYQIDILFSTAHTRHRVASETFNINVNRAITKYRR